jgi:drug/metabolite transporter (DMT)-like permease
MRRSRVSAPAPQRPYRWVAVTALLALCASAVWGASDFLGGILAKRMPAPSVVFVSQGATVAVLVVLAFAGVAPVGPRAWWGWAAAAGAVGAFALAAFYRALASGVMGVVAPIAATGVCVPVLVGLASGEQPHVAQLVGIGLGVLGVILAAGPERGGRGLEPVAFAVVAAIGFGVVLVLLARCSDQQVAGTLLVQKGTQFLVMGLVVLAVRSPVPASLRAVPLVALVGWGDASANGLYVLATRSGYLSVVSVFASLYPVATVLIARRVLHERLRRVQVLGVVVAVAGVVLMAGG